MAISRGACLLKVRIAICVLASLTVVLALTQAGAGASDSLHDIILLSRSEFFVSEVSGAGAVELKRCCHGSSTATVDAATGGGSAVAGEDYTATSRTITFTSPIEDADLEVPITDDTAVEPLETIEVTLSRPTGNATLGPSEGTITIMDDDGPARFSFWRADAQSYENYGTIEFVVIRSGDVAPATSVTYSTTDGSAEAGSDYSAASGTITFEATQRIKRFSVSLTNDSLKEGAEDFTVTLSAPVGGELSEPSSITATILDDETPASDTSPPVSYFHQPLHEESYRPRQIRDILAFADDYGTGVKRVDVALMAQKMNGTCAWFSKRRKEFVRGSCTEKVWMRFSTSETVVYRLPQRLRPSRGTKIRFYEAWSRGIDEIGNVEQIFDPFRNFSRFEVR